jgi:hypothetical protein
VPVPSIPCGLDARQSGSGEGVWAKTSEAREKTHGLRSPARALPVAARLAQLGI